MHNNGKVTANVYVCVSYFYSEQLSICTIFRNVYVFNVNDIDTISQCSDDFHCLNCFGFSLLVQLTFCMLAAVRIQLYQKLREKDMSTHTHNSPNNIKYLICFVCHKSATLDLFFHSSIFFFSLFLTFVGESFEWLCCCCFFFVCLFYS